MDSDDDDEFLPCEDFDEQNESGSVEASLQNILALNQLNIEDFEGDGSSQTQQVEEEELAKNEPVKKESLSIAESGVEEEESPFIAERIVEGNESPSIAERRVEEKESPSFAERKVEEKESPSIAERRAGEKEALIVEEIEMKDNFIEESKEEITQKDLVEESALKVLSETKELPNIESTVSAEDPLIDEELLGGWNDGWIDGNEVIVEEKDPIINSLKDGNEAIVGKKDEILISDNWNDEIETSVGEKEEVLISDHWNNENELKVEEKEKDLISNSLNAENEILVKEKDEISISDNWIDGNEILGKEKDEILISDSWNGNEAVVDERDEILISDSWNDGNEILFEEEKDEILISDSWNDGLIDESSVTKTNQTFPSSSSSKGIIDEATAPSLNESETVEGGWFGWSAISSVASALTSNIKQSVDTVYEALDPDWAKQSIHEPVEESNKFGLLLEGIPPAQPKKFNPAEYLLKTIDVTFDFASETLGNAVFAGVENTLPATAAISSKGEKLIEKGISVLESIGQKTASVITAKFGAFKEEDIKIKSQVEALLEGNCCLAHLQALEILSKEQCNKWQLMKESMSSIELNEVADRLEQFHSKYFVLSSAEDENISLLLKSVNLKEDLHVKKFEKIAASSDFMESFAALTCYSSELMLRIAECLIINPSSISPSNLNSLFSFLFTMFAKLELKFTTTSQASRRMSVCRELCEQIVKEGYEQLYTFYRPFLAQKQNEK